MIRRHLLDSGEVLYCSLDEIPALAGGGWHAVVVSPTAVLAAQTFPDEAAATRWLAERIPRGHACGIGCRRADP